MFRKTKTCPKPITPNKEIAPEILSEKKKPDFSIRLSHLFLQVSNN